jgi:zinc protease
MVDQDQIALNIRAQPEESLDPSLFLFTMTPRAGVDPALTEKVLYEEIGQLQSTLVAPTELTKAKNQLLANHYRQFETIGGRADLLGTYEVFHGDFKKLYRLDKEIDAVTPEDVQRVAKKYFLEKNRTVATLIPEVRQ